MNSPSETKVIHALGPEYSFSHEAALAYQQAYPSSEVVLHGAIEKVWSQLGPKGHRAIVPIENSSDGFVLHHADWLAAAPDVQVIDELRHRVNMCVGGLPGVDLNQVTRARSHPKAVGQSSRFLSALPSLTEKPPSHSTSAAVQEVVAEGDVNQIALGTRIAIKEYGLTLVKKWIANLKKNTTRMYVVNRNGTEPQPNPERLYHALYLVPENIDGILSDILLRIKQAGIGLRGLHSRATDTETNEEGCLGLDPDDDETEYLGGSDEEEQYGFYLQMHRKKGSPDEFADMVNDLQPYMGKGSRWLGSWNQIYTS